MSKSVATETLNLTASMSRYGYPVAEFSETTLTVSRRAVVASAVIWDAEYGAFRVIGHYAKKDGTAGAQIAKPLAFGSEIPSDVREAIKALIK